MARASASQGSAQADAARLKAEQAYDAQVEAANLAMQKVFRLEQEAAQQTGRLKQEAAQQLGWWLQRARRTASHRFAAMQLALAERCFLSWRQEVRLEAFKQDAAKAHLATYKAQQETSAVEGEAVLASLQAETHASYASELSVEFAAEVASSRKIFLSASRSEHAAHAQEESLREAAQFQ